jgi:hypothetical protein
LRHALLWHSNIATVISMMRSVSLPAGLPRRRPRFPGLGFIDHESTASTLLALEPRNRGVGCLAVGHFDKPETFGAAGVAVGNDTGLVHHAIWLKQLAEGVISDGKREIAYIDIHVQFLGERR